MSERKSEMRPIEPNMLKYFAAAARKGRQGINAITPSIQYKDNPRFGVGDVLFGQSPEVLEQASLGFYPWSGRGQTWTLDPEALDVLGMPTLGAGAVAAGVAKAGARKGGKVLAKTLGEETAEETVDLGRREVLKGLGAAGGVAAVPAALWKAMDGYVARAAPAAAAKIVRPTASELITKMSKTAVDRVKETAARMKDAWASDPKYSKQLRQSEIVEDLLNKLPEDFNVLNTYARNQIDDMDDFLKRLPDDIDPEIALKRVLGDPDVEYPKFEGVGAKVDWTVENGISTNPRWDTRNRALMKKMEEAEEALYKTDPIEIDVWQATGKPPDSYPKELLDYLDDDLLKETGGKISNWDEYSGMHYSPETAMEQYINDELVRIDLNTGKKLFEE